MKYSLKLGKASLYIYYVVKKFTEFALSGAIFEKQAFLCFAIFCENSKWPPFLLGQKKLGQLLRRVTLQFKIFVEIALSSMVSEIQAFVFCIFGKIQKFKMAAIFGK